MQLFSQKKKKEKKIKICGVQTYSFKNKRLDANKVNIIIVSTIYHFCYWCSQSLKIKKSYHNVHTFEKAEEKKRKKGKKKSQKTEDLFI